MCLPLQPKLVGINILWPHSGQNISVAYPGKGFVGEDNFSKQP